MLLYWLLAVQTVWAVGNTDLQLSAKEQAFLTEHPEITIAFDGDYAPYSFLNEAGEFEGIAVDFTREIARRAGLKLNIYHDGSWKGLYAAAKKRKVDVIATLVKRPERVELFEFTQPYISLAQYIITQKDNDAIVTSADLAGRNMALVMGYSTTSYLLEEFPSIKPHAVKNLTEALRAVSLGKAEATVAGMGMAQHLIAKRALGNLKFAALYTQGLSEQRFGVRKDWPELAAILEKSLATLSEADRLRIFQYWSRPEIARVEVVIAPADRLNLTAAEKNWLDGQKTIRIGTMDAWPPLSFVDKEGNAVGIGRDIIDALNKRLQGKMEIVPGTWKSIYDDMLEQRLDAIMDITPHPARDALFNFTTPYLDIPHVIVARKDTPQLHNEYDLNGKVLALEEGFVNVTYFKENYPDVQIREYRDTTHALGAVARGEAYAYAGNRSVALYLIEREVITNLRVHGRLQKTGSILAIGTGKEQPVMRDVLQKALDDIPPDEMRTIVSKWVTPEAEEQLLGEVVLTPEEQLWLRAHPVIRLGVDAGFAPYSFVDEQGKFQGVAADFATAIGRMLGVRMEMTPELSWPEIIQGSKDKTIDLIATASYRPEREAFLNFTEGYIPTPLVIMTRADDNRVQERADIADLKVALIEGYNASKSIMQEFEGLEVVSVKTPLDGLRAVALGRADAYVGVLGINIYQTQLNGITNLKVAAPYDLDTNYQRYGVRKDWPILATILDKALQAIPQERINDIFQKWVPVTQKKGSSITVNLTIEEKKWLKEHPLIRTAIDRNWAPVEYVDEKERFQGISADYLRLLEEILGVQFELAKEFSWQQAMQAYKKGELDMFTSLRETPERSDHLNFTTPYVSFPIAIFTGPKVPYIGAMNELDGRRVGVIQGYATEEFLKSRHPAVNRVATKDMVQALEMLSRGELDAFIGNILVTGYYIGQLGYTHIKVAGETPYRYQQSFGVRNDWTLLPSILDKALAAIPEADHRAIYNRWISVRYEQGFDYGLFWKVLVGILIIFTAFIYWNRRLALLNSQLQLSHKQEEIARMELQTANKKLLDLDKLKSMFIASMSHELRTPLNSIIGFSGLMLEGVSGDMTAQQKDSMERIYRSGNHLLDLISDVIDISKIEAGRVDAFPTPFPLKELVEEAIETIRPQADAKGLELSMQADAWPEMMTDRKRLLQCLLNYLSNAVKFTERGHITFSVSDNGDTVRISVTDTGLGISEEDIPKLFEAFERLESHLRVKAGGTGLGLYLTKKIVTELLRGDTFVQSRVDRGSTFGLQIPKHIGEKSET